MKNWLPNIIDKVFSARFLITVMIGFTYCKMVHHCVYFYLASMKSDPGKLEAFVTGLIMGFSSIAMFVIKSYFDRTDRPVAVSPDTDTTKVSIESPKATVEQIKGIPPTDPTGITKVGTT